jgi:hypothetical protein
MTCFIDGCTTKVKARSMCNTHYQAWWKLQPVENRNPNKGRPRKQTVSYWGMHSRVRLAKGSASNYPCIDCNKPANDWTHNYYCEDVLYGKGRKNRPNLNPYCLHLEHYEPRCTPCHMYLDKVLNRLNMSKPS